MTTLIAVYNSEGCVGKCDAHCHDATEPKCVCICGGANHGVGKARAVKNTLKMAETWVEDWATEHEIDRAKTLVLSEPVQQTRLPI